MSGKRHERPVRRVNPSGQVVWVARFTDQFGKRRVARPTWNRGRGTFETRRDAQRAIDEAYEQGTPAGAVTVAGYADGWTVRHPRAARTNASYQHRVGRVLEVVVEGRPFGSWPLGEVRRRQANAIVDVLLRAQGRSAVGAQGIVRVLSALWEDAINDELAEVNPWRGVRVRAADPRVVKRPREVRVFSWRDMHAFARAAAVARTGGADMNAWRPVYAEAMVRVLSDCGLRLGELLPLERRDLQGASCSVRGCQAGVPHLHVRRTTHEGWVTDGTKTDHGEAAAGRVVPVAGVLEGMLRGLPARIDTPLMFPTPRGRLWRGSGFYRGVWTPAQGASGLDVRPHEMRHSFVSLLRAAGIDEADLAAMTGHTVMTMHSRYTHAVGRSFDAMREAVGG